MSVRDVRETLTQSICDNPSVLMEEMEMLRKKLSLVLSLGDAKSFDNLERSTQFTDFDFAINDRQNLTGSVGFRMGKAFPAKPLWKHLFGKMGLSQDMINVVDMDKMFSVQKEKLTMVVMGQVFNAKTARLLVEEIPKKVDTQAAFFIALMSNYWNVRSARLHPIYTLNMFFESKLPAKKQTSDMSHLRQTFSDIDISSVIEKLEKLKGLNLYQIGKDRLFAASSSLFSGSGPFTLKILQQMQNSTKDPRLSKVLSSVVDSAPGMSSAEFKIFESSYIKDALPGNVDQHIMPGKSGSASIGQVFFSFFDENATITTSKLQKHATIATSLDTTNTGPNTYLGTKTSLDTVDTRKNLSTQADQSNPIATPFNTGSKNHLNETKKNHNFKQLEDMYATQPVVIKMLKPLSILFFLCEVDYMLQDTWGTIATVADEMYPLPKDASDVSREANEVRAQNRKIKIQSRRLLCFLILEIMKEFRFCSLENSKEWKFERAVLKTEASKKLHESWGEAEATIFFKENMQKIVGNKLLEFPLILYCNPLVMIQSQVGASFLPETVDEWRKYANLPIPKNKSQVPGQPQSVIKSKNYFQYITLNKFITIIQKFLDFEKYQQVSLTSRAIKKNIRQMQLLQKTLKLTKTTIQTLTGWVASRVNELTAVWLQGLLVADWHAFHADAHTGNIMLPPPHELAVLLASKTQTQSLPRVALIDFGSFAAVSKKQASTLRKGIFLAQNIKSLPGIEEFHEILDSKNKTTSATNSTHITPIVDTLLKEPIWSKVGPHVQNLRFYDRETQLTFFYLILSNKKRLEQFIKQAHRSNKKVLQRFVLNLEELCEVTRNQNNEEERDRIVNAMLDYTELMDYGGLFMSFVLNTTELGNCSSNQVLMFGRGIAYILRSLERISNLCNRACMQAGTECSTCPAVDLIQIISQMTLSAKTSLLIEKTFKKQ